MNERAKVNWNWKYNTTNISFIYWCWCCCHRCWGPFAMVVVGATGTNISIRCVVLGVIQQLLLCSVKEDADAVAASIAQRVWWRCCSAVTTPIKYARTYACIWSLIVCHRLENKDTEVTFEGLMLVQISWVSSSTSNGLLGNNIYCTKGLDYTSAIATKWKYST